MKTTILMLIVLCTQLVATSQTNSFTIHGSSSLCGTVYVTFYAVDGNCNSYASVPFAVNANSNLTPNLFSPGTWAGSSTPPAGVTVDAAYVDYGPSCGQGNPASPTMAGCPHYDYAMAGDPSSCAFSVSSTSCFEDSGLDCATCGVGKVISIYYYSDPNEPAGGTVATTVW